VYGSTDAVFAQLDTLSAADDLWQRLRRSRFSSSGGGA
jgi:hypothetical protein